jgi:hypothetical protein
VIETRSVLPFKDFKYLLPKRYEPSFFFKSAFGVNIMKKHFSTEDVITLEGLDRQRTTISLESNNPSEVLSANPNKLPGFLADIKNFVLTRLNPFKHHIDLVDSRFIEEKFRNIDYIQASQLGVITPVGFKGTWLNYMAVLAESQAQVTNLQTGLLKPFELYLSELLNTPDHLRANSVGSQLAKFKPNKPSVLKAKFAGFIGTGGSTESTYGEVVKRHADLPLVTRELNEINTRFASIDRTVLIKQVNSVSGMLDTLIGHIKEDPETYVISGACLKALTDLTYYMAEEVEFYTIHGYFLETFTLSVKDSYAMLKKSVDR